MDKRRLMKCANNYSSGNGKHRVDKSEALQIAWTVMKAVQKNDDDQKV